MNDITFLHRGLDRLEVSFRGLMPRRHQLALAEVKGAARAQGDDKPYPAEIDGLPVLVHATGGRGGYEWRFEINEPLGETWLVKEADNPVAHNLRVTVGSDSCARYGWSGLTRRLIERLRGFGVTSHAASVGRIDICTDFIAPGFVPDPELIHAHPRSRTQAVLRQGLDCMIEYSGTRLTGLTIGKLPNRQMQLYDKSLEVRKTGKHHWFRLWGIDPEELEHPVWRLEWRFGKDHLKRKWQTSSFGSIEDSLMPMLRTAMDQIFMEAPGQTDRNVTRRQRHPVWQAARTQLLSYEPFEDTGLVTGQPMVGQREEFIRNNKANLCGAVRNLAALCLSPDATLSDHSQLAAEIINAAASEEPNEWFKRIDLTRERLKHVRS